jgi:hypothetical protein
MRIYTGGPRVPVSLARGEIPQKSGHLHLAKDLCLRHNTRDVGSQAARILKEVVLDRKEIDFAPQSAQKCGPPGEFGMKASLLYCIVFIGGFGLFARAQQSQPVNGVLKYSKAAEAADRSVSKSNKSLPSLWPEASTANDSNVCAFIRTYRVMRPYRDSDFVERDGYSTCLPSRRFDLKTALEIEQPESDR